MQHQTSYRIRLLTILLVTVFTLCAVYGAGTETVSAAARLKVTPASKAMAVGSKATLKANKNVKWSLSNNRGNIKIVTKSSKAITVKGLKSGTVYIKAKSGKNTIKTKVEVGKAPKKITLVKEKDIVGVRNTCLVYVDSVTPSNASKAVIFSSSDENVATVNNNGTVTGVSAGKVTITAKSKFDKTKKSSVEITVVNSLMGSVKVTADLSDESKYPKGKEAKVWIPVPSTDDKQIVPSSLLAYSSPKAAEIKLTNDSAGNKCVYVKWDENTDPADRKVSVSYHVIRLESVLPDDIERREQGTVDTAEMAEYLKETKRTGALTSGVVQETADKVVNSTNTKTVYGRAKAIYDWVCKNVSIDDKNPSIGSGDVEYILKHTDEKSYGSADANAVFVAMCRAEGIPARCIYGLKMDLLLPEDAENPVDEDKLGNKELQSCKAQFNLPGYGWVDVDASSERCWGTSSATWYYLTTGADIKLSPQQSASVTGDDVINEDGTLTCFAYPYAEFDGQYIRCYKNSKGEASELNFVYNFVKDREDCGCA